MVEQQAVSYDMTITIEEALLGTKKLLTRNGKRLEVTIPIGVKTGNMVRLSNALRLTDGHSGDILIQINVSEPARTLAGVIEITDATFESEVLSSKLPVVVDFWAPWCGPCRMMAPVMDKLAEEYNGKLKFCKLNVDENQQTATSYQAQSIPLLLFFKNGSVVDKSLGAVPENVIRPKLEALL